MNAGIIIYVILSLIILGILILFHKQVTIPAGIAILFISTMLLSIIGNPGENPWILLVIPLVIAGFCGFKYKFPSLNFSKRIINLAFPKKGKDGRVIGKCFPYYKKQLKYNHATIMQSELAMQGGTILTGSSGSGKTYGMINSMKQDLAAGRSVAFFDFKGDIKTLKELEKDLPAKVKLYKLTWEGCNFTYDPLINLDESGKVEAILNIRPWSMDNSDAHYKTGVQLFLQKSIQEYQHQSGNYLLGYYNFLQKYNVPREHFEAYNTVIKLLELTMTSKIRSMFTDGGNQFHFDAKEQYLLFVSFTSASKALGTAVTSLMLKDLMEIATVKGYNPILGLYLDEFGSCESPLAVKDILEKGRSGHVATTLSLQDLSQLRISTNSAFVDSILGTVNSYTVYAGSTRAMAELIAGTQVYEIEDLLMSLKKPVNGKPPTSMFISKYPVFEKGGTEVYRYIPISNIKDKIQIANKTKEVDMTLPRGEIKDSFPDPNQLINENGTLMNDVANNINDQTVQGKLNSTANQQSVPNDSQADSASPSVNFDDFL